VSHPGTQHLFSTLAWRGENNEHPKSLSPPDSVSIRPEQDFETVDSEFGPLPLDATEKEAAHRYRLAQATNMLRLGDVSVR
jgi:hypothetical protein